MRFPLPIQDRGNRPETFLNKPLILLRDAPLFPPIIEFGSAAYHTTIVGGALCHQ
jgi:hypothetical protein